jgi:hypothetical protein
MSLFFADVRQRYDLQIAIRRYQIGLFHSVRVDESCVVVDGSKRESVCGWVVVAFN